MPMDRTNLQNPYPNLPLARLDLGHSTLLYVGDSKTPLVCGYNTMYIYIYTHISYIPIYVYEYLNKYKYIIYIYIHTPRCIYKYMTCQRG